MVTVSPSLTRKQGETCAGMLPWRFSYLQRGHRLLRDCLQGQGALGCAFQEQVARANAPRILLDVVRVIAPHDDGAVHLCRLYNPCTSTAHLSARA